MNPTHTSVIYNSTLFFHPFFCLLAWAENCLRKFSAHFLFPYESHAYVHYIHFITILSFLSLSAVLIWKLSTKIFCAFLVSLWIPRIRPLYPLQHYSFIPFSVSCLELKIAYENSLRISCFPTNSTRTAQYKFIQTIQ